MNLTGIKEIEFNAICSGDGECFCWEVDKETYIKIKGWDNAFSPYDCVKLDFTEDMKPIMKSDRFRIYPDDIFGYTDEGNEKKIYIKWEYK